MRFFRTSACGLVLAASVIGGCASQPARDEPTGDRVCVRVSRISSMTALDDRHVLARAGASHYYLFSVDRGCRGISFAGGMSIVEATSRVCGDGFSFIAFDHPGAGTKRCRIQRIERVADRKEAEALIESRMRAEAGEKD